MVASFKIIHIDKICLHNPFHNSSLNGLEHSFSGKRILITKDSCRIATPEVIVHGLPAVQPRVYFGYEILAPLPGAWFFVLIYGYLLK
jgi:hypothetical protein